MEQQVIDHLIAKYQPLSIILHGSRADGSNRKDSDWDIFVFTSGDASIDRTELFEGQELDVNVLPFPQELNEEVLAKKFGSALKNAKVVFDTDDKGSDFLRKAQEIYENGRHLSQEEIEYTKRRFNRILSRLRANVDNDQVFFYYAATFHHSIIRYWFEMRNEWPEPIKHALAKIESEDADYAEQLKIIASSSDRQAKLGAFETIYRILFE